MASLSWPWEPLEPKDSLSEGERHESTRPVAPGREIANSESAPAGRSLSESEYDAEEYDTMTARWYDEMNRSIEPQMEEWRPER